MASVGAMWGPTTLRLLRVAVSRTAAAVRTATRPLQGQVEHVTLRTRNQPIHPAALLKQQKRGARWFSSNTARNVNRVVRRYFTSEAGGVPRLDRSKLPSSNTSRRVAQFSGRAPFANTLRPNLTGGALPRTAGGYSLGGGARYFSHGPAAPAQVVQNVSQAMRAIFVSGQKLRYDGMNARGDRQYRSVSDAEDRAMRKFAGVPFQAAGAYVDFQTTPEVTALSPLAAAIANNGGFQAEAIATETTLETDGFLDTLSADFGRTLKNLTAIHADLARLKAFGGMPVTLEGHGVIRVRFPGVDADTVEALCAEAGIQRGVVGEDANFGRVPDAPISLQFPYAPGEDRTVSSPGGSTRALDDYEFEDSLSSLSDDSFIRQAFVEEVDDNPWLSDSDSDGYKSMSPPLSSGQHVSTDFEGLEGIYRFIEECDRGRDQFR
ncbi:uncharacterized protein F5Z01DRAFT_644624 [Emericellopsis atlantica]|uniref:Casein kinase II beta 2 subunit n=1 Tax=Emericellopsis atlantica TaxID=2614577 RepID=A0A9P7ZTR0_9HYPO|nr:uncharacterized protein F5Z01DRAFT_644624 [Emericellopsis atlantica]KAG9257936.1 hypothetical protein F5Z01DRAFT_644624 [Emericellopsis atlantica]